MNTKILNFTLVYMLIVITLFLSHFFTHFSQQSIKTCEAVAWYWLFGIDVGHFFLDQIGWCVSETSIPKNNSNAPPHVPLIIRTHVFITCEIDIMKIDLSIHISYGWSIYRMLVEFPGTGSNPMKSFVMVGVVVITHLPLVPHIRVSELGHHWHR